MPLSRRALLGAALATSLASRPLTAPVRAQSDAIPFAYPIGDHGHPAGDGFFVRVGFACENLAEYPGWWHTGENWHRIDGAETGGAPVLAAAAGEVIFAGYDYPGPVVILRHGPELYT